MQAESAHERKGMEEGSSPEAAMTSRRRPILDVVSRMTESELGIHVLSITVFYILLVVLFSLSTEKFRTVRNARNILANTSVLGIVTVGQAFVLLGGGFDLSVGGTVPLGAIAFTLLVNHGCGVALATTITVFMGAAIGLANAFITVKVGIAPMITTLGTLSITKALAYIISGGVAIPFRNPNSGFLAQTFIGGVALYVWAFLLLGLISHLVLRYTVFGRQVYAVGGNREASRLAGIRVEVVYSSLYVVCASLAALSGVLTASQLLLGSATVGADAPLTSIAAVILGGAALGGGVGGIPGTLVGILIMGTLSNGMALMHVRAYYQEMANGIMLLAAVGMGRTRGILASVIGRSRGGGARGSHSTP